MNTDQLKVWSTIADQPANYYVSASDAEREIMRDWVTGLLREREITVTFNRADGAERVMRCTLQASMVPQIVRENSEPRKYNPDVCAVWDVKQGAWRSFRWDRITRIEFDLG